MVFFHFADLCGLQILRLPGKIHAWISDRITDSSVKKIFESLIQSKILINMHLTGTKFDQLTVMTGLRRKLGRLHFLLGYPDGFAEAAAGTKAGRSITNSPVATVFRICFLPPVEKSTAVSSASPSPNSSPANNAVNILDWKHRTAPRSNSISTNPSAGKSGRCQCRRRADCSGLFCGWKP